MAKASALLGSENGRCKRSRHTDQATARPSRGVANTVLAARAKLAPLLPCILSLAGVAACTWISFGLGQNLGSAGFLYLVFVVLAAVYGGFWQATLVSVVSVACLDFFFDEPILSFTVGRLSNWVELGAFEFTFRRWSSVSSPTAPSFAPWRRKAGCGAIRHVCTRRPRRISAPRQCWRPWRILVTSADLRNVQELSGRRFVRCALRHYV